MVVVKGIMLGEAVSLMVDNSGSFRCVLIRKHKFVIKIGNNFEVE